MSPALSRFRTVPVGRWLFGLGCLLTGVALAQPPGREPGLPEQQPTVRVPANIPLVKVADYTMRETRAAPAAVTDGRYIYIIGGIDRKNELLRSIERFDPATGVSEPFATLKHGRLWHQAVIHDGRIYVLGGSMLHLNEGLPAYEDLLRAPNERRAKARIDDESDPALQRVLNGTEYSDSVEIVDLATRQVTRGPDLPDARNQFGCLILGGELYVIGGHRLNRGRPSYTNTVKIFSFVKNRWRDGLPMPSPRLAAATLVDGPFIVVPGGYGLNGTSDAVEAYDPRSNKWIVLPPLCRAVSAHSLAFLGHSLFLFGNYEAPDELVAYDLFKRQSESFTLQYKPTRHTAAVVLDGRIYVIGGRPTKAADPVDFIQVFALPPKSAAAR